MSCARPGSDRSRGRSAVLALVVAALIVAPVGLSLASTPASAQQAGGENGEGTTDIVVRQGGQCYPVESFGNGTTSVQEFYSYRNPVSEPTGWYSAYGELADLLREDTSQVLLYNGSNGLSLVFVNDGVSTVNGSGGTATIDVTGLPADGNWSVQDDDYPGQDDVFDVGGSSAHVEWVWNEGNRSDGAAFVGLGGSDWEEITVRPRFNEASPRYPSEKWDGPPESNQVERWVVRSANESASATATNTTDTTNGTNVTTNRSVTTDTDANATDGNGSATPNATVSASATTEANTTDGNETRSANGTAPDAGGTNGTVYELNMSEPITVARGPCDDEPPAAALTASSQNPTLGAEVTLDANGSTDNDAIAAYRWDLNGDGTVETVTNGSSLTATYNQSGSYDARVTVIDHANNTANASVSLQVEEETTTTTTTTTPTTTATSTNAPTTATNGGTTDTPTTAGGSGGTTDAAAPTTEGESGGDPTGGSDIRREVERTVDRVSKSLSGMDDASLVGLGVLAVALVVIGLVVFRR